MLEAAKPGATIVPLLVSTDRTQLTLFGSKSAYPVYLTIGNIPKAIRRKPSCRAQVLLAYLPSTKLKCISCLASRRRILANLFHSCMGHIFQPLEDAGIQGIPMRDGLGIWRRLHPILAVFIGDYPEQVLVTATKTKDCPKGNISSNSLGCYDEPCHPRDLSTIKDKLLKADTDPYAFRQGCEALRIKPVYHPFWISLPFLNIFQSIGPDILHQLLQGLLKHLLSWLSTAYGASEIDARAQRVIPNFHIRIFLNGITELSRVTGKEHDLMCRILLGLVVNAQLPNDLDPARMIRAVRAFLDFLYLARLQVHTTKTLHHLELALARFHDNKSIFVDLNIRKKGFNIPKLHACQHYVESIKRFGSTDNYDTQHTEHLHIEFTKDAYRATNTRDELPQMTKWLERQEQVHRHGNYISQETRKCTPKAIPPIPELHPKRRIKMTVKPSVRGVSIAALASNYGAHDFRDAFARFAIQRHQPGIQRAQLEREMHCFVIPFTTVSVYHCIKYEDVEAQAKGGLAIDAIYVQAQRHGQNGRIIPGRFDTALVHCGTDQHRTGVHGMYL